MASALLMEAMSRPSHLIDTLHPKADNLSKEQSQPTTISFTEEAAMSRIRFSTLLYVGVLLALAACQSQAALLPAPTSLPPTAIPATEAPTAILPTPGLPTVTAFSSNVYKLPMTVSFGPDWHVSEDYTDLVTIETSQHDWPVSFNIVTQAQLADPADGHLIPFPEDFATWIMSDPDFKVGEPQPVMVAGVKGLQIDATPVWSSTTTNKKPFLALRSSGWNIITKPERWRFIMLNVNGERLLILLIAPADEFDTAAQKAQGILDSVVFTR
jgi:hypothetical protein